jgi:hypothetical protein
MDHMLTNPQAERGAAPRPVIDLHTLLNDCDEAETSLANIGKHLGLICTGHDRITDVRRLAVFCRLLRSAEHELEAATRPRGEAAS